MTTQYANASYQEIIDLHTESDSVSVIGIHTPISDTPHKMMKGFFEQFKKFKYAGCSVSLVPAARLPADPLQVSYEAGETTIDPRDMLNPLMFHGCHGNDLGMVLNRLYNLNSGNSLASDSVNLHQGDVIQSDFVESDLVLDGQELENLYYKALTDNTWKKAHPQRGFRKSGLHPMIYSLATTQQIMNESLIAAPTSPYNIGLTRGVPAPAEFDYDTVSNPAEWSVDVPINRQFKLMTPRIQKLGWLDTKQVLTNAGTAEGTFSTTGMSESEVREALSEAFTGALNGIVESQEVYATLPKIYMGVILMPPAYKTEQYFRMIITHHFEFKNFRGISFANDIHESPCYDNWNEDISLGTGGDTGGEVDPPNPDDPDNPGEGGGDEPLTVSFAASSDPYTLGNYQIGTITSGDDSTTFECHLFSSSGSYKGYAFDVDTTDKVVKFQYYNFSLEPTASWVQLSSGDNSSSAWVDSGGNVLSSDFTYFGYSSTNLTVNGVIPTSEQLALIKTYCNGMFVFDSVTV